MIGKEIIQLYSIDSTNQYLGELLEKNNLQEGLVVTAVNQTNGKGLDKNRWESEPGKNLTLSVLLKPLNVPPVDQFILTKCIALAVMDFINSFHLPGKTTIKWTNDIYVNDHKIAGILINNTIKGDRLEYTVAGIGININQTNFRSNAPNPVSLKAITRQDYLLTDCMHMLIDCLDARYQEVLSNEFEKIDSDYMIHQYRADGMNPFLIGGEKVIARISGIDRYGRLLILTDENKKIACNYGDIKYLTGDKSL